MSPLIPLIPRIRPLGRNISRILVVVFSVILLGLGNNADARQSETAYAAAGQDQAGVFDYYLLTLSWSPTYCLTHPQDHPQCGSGKGYGLVLHGLWPQYARGGYPQDCYTPERLTPEAVAFGNTIFPSPTLIDHEWSKHGTCSGLSALAYFKTADGARTSVKVPAALESPATTHSMSAADIIKGFVSANPGMPAKAVVVACSGPELAEVRVCMTRDLHPMACGKGVSSSCRAGPIRIPSSR